MINSIPPTLNQMSFIKIDRLESRLIMPLMSKLIRAINKDPFSYRYIDTEQMIQYIFAGFEGKLSQTQKKKLIKARGRPRSQPIMTLAATDRYEIRHPEPLFETQVITQVSEPSNET
jgi:hypothetical protein